MKHITSLFLILISAGGLGMFLGSIGRIVDSIGAIHYWEAVGIAYLLGITTYLLRLRKGFELRGQAVLMTPLCFVSGAVAFPVAVAFIIPSEHLQDSQEIAWLITVCAFVFITSCGFTGTKANAATS